MLNRILMELYDEYANNNIEPLIEFSKKTFPQDGTDKLFVGCTLIMFSRAHDFKPRYDCDREQLLEIVSSIKQKIGNTNLLDFYLVRLNKHKGISKHFNNIFNDEELDKHVDLLIKYLNKFKPTFIEEIKKYNEKIDDFIK